MNECMTLNLVTARVCCVLRVSLRPHWRRDRHSLVPSAELVKSEMEFALYKCITIIPFVLLSLKPGEAMGRYTQCLMDGSCYVLFSGELQQPGVDRYFCGLCGTRGFCAKHYGPPHICSHLLRALCVADSCSDVYRPKYYGCYKVRQVRRAFSPILGLVIT